LTRSLIAAPLVAATLGGKYSRLALRNLAEMPSNAQFDMVVATMLAPSVMTIQRTGAAAMSGNSFPGSIHV
jgi:hypothetical protein